MWARAQIEVTPCIGALRTVNMIALKINKGAII